MTAISWNWEDLTTGRTAGKTLADGLDDGELSRPEILAREITQNSIDATDAFRKSEFPDHSPRLIFRYKEYRGAQKATLIDVLGLREIALHAPNIKSRQSEMLADNAVLKHLDDLDSPIRVLVAEDYGAHGLFGDKWVIALRGTGISDHEDGHASGGTFGFGKGAFHIGSSLSLVAAFSQFQSAPHSSNVESCESRFGAYLYQNPHLSPDTGIRLTGFAESGDTSQDQIAKLTRPFEGATALDLAGQIGLTREEVSGVNALGTSFMMIDPVVGPEELSRALEESWWPALVDGLIAIDVIDAGGERFTPRPKARDDLRPFVEAWAWFSGSSRTKGEFQKLRKLQPKVVDGNPLGLGQIAIWANPETAFDVQSDDDDRASEIALVRQRRMVVRYHPYYRGKPPFVQGILFTDSEIEDFVSKVEPKLHNYWWQGVRDVKSYHPPAHKDIVTALAIATYNLIREFRGALSPKIDQATVRLERLSKLLGSMFSFSDGGGSRGPEPVSFEPIAVSFPESSFTRKVLRSGARVYGGRLGLRLTEEFKLDSAQVRASVRFSVVEDAGSKGRQVATSYLKVPPGWTAGDDGSIVGELSRQELVVMVETDEVGGPYEVAARVEVQIVGGAGA